MATYYNGATGYLTTAAAGTSGTANITTTQWVDPDSYVYYTSPVPAPKRNLSLIEKLQAETDEWLEEALKCQESY